MASGVCGRSQEGELFFGWVNSLQSQTNNPALSGDSQFMQRQIEGPIPRQENKHVSDYIWSYPRCSSPALPSAVLLQVSDAFGQVIGRNKFAPQFTVFRFAIFRPCVSISKDLGELFQIRVIAVD